MLKKLAAVPVLAFIVLIEPLHAIAQQAAPPPPPQGYYGPGPWHMWNDGQGARILDVPADDAVPGPRLRGLFLRGAQILRPWHMPSHLALQILNERFGRGEIQKDEYAEKKAALLSAG